MGAVLGARDRICPAPSQEADEALRPAMWPRLRLDMGAVDAGRSVAALTLALYCGTSGSRCERRSANADFRVTG
jgi:hypothetical protein